MNDTDSVPLPDGNEGAAAPAEPCPPHPAPQDSDLSEIAKKADDLDDIKKAIDDAAAVSGGLWFSYLFVLFYFAVAAGAVTHADLFRENPVKLPFLGVDLPLTAFFFLAPILFVIVHAYILVHLVLLTDKAKRYHRALYGKVEDKDDLPPDQRSRRKAIRDDLRRRLPSNIFVQFLAGPSDVRGSAFGFALRAIGWITLVIAPILLLLLLQIQFLPYHSSWITWTQRLALAADLVLVWWLWREILSGRETEAGSGWTTWARRAAWTGAVLALGVFALAFSIAAAVAVVVAWLLCVRYVFNRKGRAPGVFLARVADACAFDAPKGGASAAETDGERAGGSWAWSGLGFALSAMAILFSFATASFPGERYEKWFDGWRFIPAADRGATQPKPQAPPDNNPSASRSFMVRVAATAAWLLKSEEADLHSWAFNSPPDPVTRRRWPFSNTLVLVGFNIYEELKIDDPTKVKGDVVFHARARDLMGAIFDRAVLPKVDFASAHLEGASLNRAQLETASLVGAKLRGASLIGTHLAGVKLVCEETPLDRLRDPCANLQGANLDGAQLQGASLDGARLQGASLSCDAQFGCAHLEGASLGSTELQGASLKNAELQGASLAFAELQGASLDGAQLQGASLDNAHLQGASLSCDAQFGCAHLEGASLGSTELQGASLRGAQLQGASLQATYLMATDLSGAWLWRTNAEPPPTPDFGPFPKRIAVQLSRASWEPSWTGLFGEGHIWDGEAYRGLRTTIEALPAENLRGQQALKNIRRLDCGSPDKTLASCVPTLEPPREAVAWRNELVGAGADETAYAAALATTLKALVCSGGDNAIFVVRGEGFQSRLGDAGAAVLGLIGDLMNKDNKDCPVVAALTDADRASLLRIQQTIAAAKPAQNPAQPGPAAPP